MFNTKKFFSGENVKSSRIFEVDKVYLLNIWSSWCVPCRQEHPLLMNLNLENKLNIIGMNYKDNLKNEIGMDDRPTIAKDEIEPDQMMLPFYNEIENFIEENLWDEIRVFSSKKNIKSGITAPKINFTKEKIINIGEDVLSISHNKSTKKLIEQSF